MNSKEEVKRRFRENWFWLVIFLAIFPLTYIFDTPGARRGGLILLFVYLPYWFLFKPINRGRK